MSKIKNSNGFMAAFAMEARALATMLGIADIKWGHSPAIDLEKKVLYLPHIPFIDDPEKLKSLRFKFRRWLAHEVGGHGRYSDPDLAKQYEEQLEEDPQLWMLFMCIEDPRIEIRYSKDYRGVTSILDDGLKAMIEDGEVRDGSNGAFDALQSFVLYTGRFFWQQQLFVEPFYEKAKSHLVDLLDEEGVELVEAMIVSDGPACTSSKDSLELGQRILSLVEDIAEEQNEEQQNNSPDPSEDSDSENDDGNSSAPEDDSGEQGGSAGENGDDSNSNNPKSGAQQILDDIPSETSSPDDAGEAFTNMVKEIVEEAGGDMDGPDGSVGAGAALGSNGDATVPADNELNYHELRDTLAGPVAMLRNQIAALLHNRTRARYVPASSGPRINQKHLWKVRLGDLNIYQRKIKEDLPTSDTSVLIDLSGSMTWVDSSKKVEKIVDGKTELVPPPTPLEIAQQVILTLGEILNSINTPYELLGFGGNNCHPAGLVEIKSFKQSFAISKKRLGGLASAAGGGTPMNEGLYEAGLRLLEQPGERKILFVLTDGGPNDRHATKDMVERLQASGVEVVGIGISSDEGEGLFDEWVRIDGVLELGDRLLNTMFSKLTAA